MSSCCIPTVTNVRISFFKGKIIFHCMYICHIFFTHSSDNRHLNCFHNLTIVNSTAIHMGVDDFYSFWYIPTSIPISILSDVYPLLGRSGITGSYGNSVFNALGETPYCFPRQLHHLHLHQQCRTVFICMIFKLCKTKYFILKLCVSWSESIKTSTLLYKISQKGSKRSTLGFVSLSLCVSVFCTTHSQSNSPLFEWV